MAWTALNNIMLGTFLDLDENNTLFVEVKHYLLTIYCKPWYFDGCFVSLSSHRMQRSDVITCRVMSSHAECMMSLDAE